MPLTEEVTRLWSSNLAALTESMRTITTTGDDHQQNFYIAYTNLQFPTL